MKRLCHVCKPVRRQRLQQTVAQRSMLHVEESSIQMAYQILRKTYATTYVTGIGMPVWISSELMMQLHVVYCRPRLMPNTLEQCKQAVPKVNSICIVATQR